VLQCESSISTIIAVAKSLFCADLPCFQSYYTNGTTILLLLNVAICDFYSSPDLRDWYFLELSNWLEEAQVDHNSSKERLIHILITK
jgi:hypothetical protein